MNFSEKHTYVICKKNGDGEYASIVLKTMKMMKKIIILIHKERMSTTIGACLISD
jgi:hypothetical protein